MIHLGYTDPEKATLIARYREAHDLRRVVTISPERFYFPHDATEVVEYANTIEYAYFYRLLQEVDAGSLVVMNETLRTQNRNDLTFNCIRHILHQAGHVLVFQYLPIIESRQDFMTLFDFATDSRWKREKFNPDLLGHAEIDCRPVPIEFLPVRLTATNQKAYEAKKKKLFDEIGVKDPDTIPRNLYLLAGADKAKVLDPHKTYVARNQRLKLPNTVTYDTPTPDVTVLEFPHNFITFIDFVSRTRQTKFDVLVTDLKVDLWYYDRYQGWLKELHETYATIQQQQKRPAGGP